MGRENVIASHILLSIVDEHKTSNSRDELARELIHARDVRRWLLIINPQASFEVRIAALLHDCERLTDRGEEQARFKGDRSSETYLEHKRNHAARSATLAGKMLTQNNIETSVILRVCWLISHHDDTGEQITTINDPELSELAAADTFSFFTSIARNMLDREGPERLTDKIRFMVGKTPPHLRLRLANIAISDREVEVIKDDVLRDFIN